MFPSSQYSTTLVMVTSSLQTDGFSKVVELARWGYTATWLHQQVYIFSSIITRPNVAGAVLLTPLSLIDSFSHWLMLFLQTFKTSLHPICKSQKAKQNVQSMNKYLVFIPWRDPPVKKKVNISSQRVSKSLIKTTFTIGIPHILEPLDPK